MRDLQLILRGTAWLVVIAACVEAAPRRLSAQVLTNSPLLPPNAVYFADSQFTTYSGGGLVTTLDNPLFRPNQATVQRQFVGNDEIDTFNVDLTGGARIIQAEGMVFNPPIPLEVAVAGPMRTRTADRLGNTTGTFAAELLEMTMSGTVITPIGNADVVIRESPTLMSPGETTITALPGGRFCVSSIYGLFTELSVDNSPFVPQTGDPLILFLRPDPQTHVIADLNLNGSVTKTDVALLAADLGFQGFEAPCRGDTNADERVGLVDIANMQRRLASLVATSGDATAVPEPHAWLLGMLLVGGAWLACRGHRVAA